MTDKAVDNDEFEAMIRMAALCWNIALLPRDQQEQRLRSILDETMAKGEPEGVVSEARAWGQVLLDRKRKLFGNDRRTVADYTMERVGGSLRLHVISGFTPR